MDAGEVRYRVTADTSAAQRDLNGLERSMSDVGDSMGEAGSQAQQSENGFRDMAETGKAAGDDLTAAFDKVKSAVGGLIAALGAAKALDMLGDLTKQCVEAYAEYEQLVGGVETLFKDAAGTVQQYAAEAFSTVGLSANDYMETVTGFSASLIASLDGDTAKAAEAANTAMVDMADNANKMGSDIQSIQNAYSGFAKQNYTMLDNLKLGYGGTQAEMERLLENAEKISGIHYELGNFADMAEAIHVIQKKMEITGTTAKEAAATISGSAAAMKAAWDNLLVGFADGEQDVSGLIATFTDSVSTLAGNVMPALTETLKALPDGLVSIANEILPVVPDLVGQLLPLITSGLGQLVTAVIDGAGDLGDRIVSYTPELISQLTEMIGDTGEHLLSALGEIGGSLSENAGKIIGSIFTSLTDILTEQLPQLVTGSAEIAQQMITGIYDGLAENLPGLLAKVPDIVSALLETFKGLTVSFGEFSLMLLEKCAGALGENLSALLDAVPDVVTALLDAFLDLAPRMAEFAAQAITEIHDGLGDNLPDLIEKCGEIIGELVRALIDHAPDFVDVAVQIVETIGDTLINTDWTGIAVDTIDSLWNALDKAWNGARTVSSGTGRADKGKFREKMGLGGSSDETDELRHEVIDRNKRTKNDIQEQTEETAEAAQELEEETQSLKERLAELDHLYAIHQKTEEEYYAEKKRILEDNRDESSEDWWADYDKVTEYYDKQAKAEQAAADKAAKEQKTAADKASKAKADEAKKRAQDEAAAEKKAKEDAAAAMRDMETAAAKAGLSDDVLLKQQRDWVEKNLDKESELYREYDNKLSKQERAAAEKREKDKADALKKQQSDTEAAVRKELEDKFRDLETEQLEKGLDSKWLSEQKRAYLETLDHDSELYKDYNLKLLKESEKQTEAEAQALKKANEMVKSAKESLEKSFAIDTGDLFKSTSVTDPMTGATDTSNSIQIENFKKQIEAKKKLPEKIAKLLDKGMPDTVIRQLLKLDPVVALEYTNELLNSPSEFNAIVSGLKADAQINVKLADIVGRSSEDMLAVGQDIGQALGEGILEALDDVFRQDMIGKFSGIGETLIKGVNAANASITGSIVPLIPVSQPADNVSEERQSAQTLITYPREMVIKLTDLNGAYIARAVNDENVRNATVSGS